MEFQPFVVDHVFSLSQFERGDVTDSNYEYVLCAPDVYADILHLRKKISKIGRAHV